MEIFEYDKRERIIEEIKEEIQATEMMDHEWDDLALRLIDDDEELINFALSFLLSNIHELEDYFYSVK